MVDGKEPPSFASSISVSPGVHRVLINCGEFRFTGLNLSPKSLIDSISLEGPFADGHKYYAQCKIDGDKIHIWLAAEPNGPPLPEFK
jgi:hypothetical protein